MKYEELTGKIIGCAMKVHSFLGNGFPEIIYQRALAIEMELAGLKFVMEKEMLIYYRDRLIGKRNVDFFVEDLIMVEIKAKSLEFKRIHNNKIFKDNPADKSS